jgi:hypothetical protein
MFSGESKSGPRMVNLQRIHNRDAGVNAEMIFMTGNALLFRNGKMKSLLRVELVLDGGVTGEAFLAADFGADVMTPGALLCPFEAPMNPCQFSRGELSVSFTRQNHKHPYPK